MNTHPSPDKAFGLGEDVGSINNVATIFSNFAVYPRCMVMQFSFLFNFYRHNKSSPRHFPRTSDITMANWSGCRQWIVLHRMTSFVWFDPDVKSEHLFVSSFGAVQNGFVHHAEDYLAALEPNHSGRLNEYASNEP
jgi:hypothetical protein